MIQVKAKTWEDAWTQLHRAYAEQPVLTIDQRFATRGFSFHNDISIDSNELGNLTPALVGYTSYKVNLFDRRYVIPGMKEKILATVSDRLASNRKLTVISYPFKEDDGAHTQGPCLINMLITIRRIGNEWRIGFDFYIRIGEITRRLLVDFIKFHEIVDYFLKGLAQYKVKLSTINVNAKALYAEPISLMIATELFADQFQYNMDHWLHQGIHQKLEKYKEQEMKFKRGRRIMKHVRRLQKG